MTARPTLLAVALLAAASVAHAQQSPPTVDQLAERLRVLEHKLGVSADAPSADASGASVADLDQRLKVIERQLELQAEDAANKAASASTLTVSAAKGVSFKSPAADGVEVKLRGLVQGDARAWIDDKALPQNDGFLLRRVQPILEGQFGKLVGFRVMPEFAGDSATIADAYIDLKFDPRATVRAGKFKAPIGLERLQSSGATTFMELGYPSELAPNRDFGAQLQGEFTSGLTYAVGAFNGAPDGRDAPTSNNPDSKIEYAGRVFWEPFREDASALSGLGFGISASTGDAVGTGSNVLPRYRTPGQVQFFGYRAAVLANGERRRWSPQAYYYNGPFGLLGEYIESKQDLRVGATSATLDNRAWQLAASWVLTGEDASYRGVTRPSHPFNVGGAGFGAVELAARIGALEIDDDAFPLFADPNAAARRSRAWTLGVNWYLTQNLKLVANYSEADFDGGAAAGADRETEKTFFTRAQVSF
ncbi:OprO/OprP family phosphate-selective porin [Cognatilysobacter terrigena]|uniref:OprO/OprP family phosphate-selective porin n=1 Tax=Cognatilysobacter terrigena TaxID=2488749 RepID=UPI00105EE0AA|nr:porin [Lysobacter terrigena]